jgi:hypothetical protein
VAHLLITLRGVLPCTYCRASYDQYLPLLAVKHAERASGDLLDALKRVPASKFVRFVYDLHEMVNDKLRSQGTPIKPYPFDLVLRKHAVFPSTLSTCALFDVLFIFALNYPEDDEGLQGGGGGGGQGLLAGGGAGVADTLTPQERRVAWVAFMRVLPRALQDVCTAPDTCQVAQALQAQMQAVKSLPAKAAVFDVVLLAWMACRRGPPGQTTAQARQELAERYQAAKAGAPPIQE